jgi:hypothetical protein
MKSTKHKPEGGVTAAAVGGGNTQRVPECRRACAYLGDEEEATLGKQSSN